MEFKGTSGEWVIEKTEIVRHASKGSISPYWKQICSFVNNGTDECKANALLISKAPEMLEMLKEIYSKYEKDKHLLNVSPSKIKQVIKEATEIK